jgi:RNA polymerase sigma-70 factor (ECF subfamily)
VGGALAGERRSDLLRAVNALRDEDREVIAVRYFLDLSEAEAAATLGIPRGTVKSRLSRALGRLRERIATNEAAQ